MILHSRELLFIYNSEKRTDRQYRARLEDLNIALNEWDLAKKPITPRQIAEISEKIEVPVRELLVIDPDENFSPGDENDALTLMSKDVARLKTPLVLKENTGRLVKSFKDLDNLGHYSNPIENTPKLKSIQNESN